MPKDEFLDEKIIEMINEVEKPTEQSSGAAASEESKTEIKPQDRTIYTGIKIAGKTIEFEERSFLEEGKIKMMVPKEFTELDAEIAKFKYPSEHRPDIILTDESGTTNILFNHMDETMDNEDAEMIRDRLIGMVRRGNPGIRPLSTGIEVISGKNVAYVEFSNPVMDGKIYNVMFFLQVADRILMGSFNCLTKVQKYWKDPAFQMMCSLQVLDQEDIAEEEVGAEENEIREE